MEEKNGRPFSLLRHMQGNSIRGDVIFLEWWFRCRDRHLTQNQTSTHSDSSRQDVAAGQSRLQNSVFGHSTHLRCPTRQHLRKPRALDIPTTQNHTHILVSHPPALLQ